MSLTQNMDVLDDVDTHSGGGSFVTDSEGD